MSIPAPTLVTPTQIATTTINNNPVIVVLGNDNYLYMLNLTTQPNKQLNTSYVRLPPIYKTTDYSPILYTSGSYSGDPIPNIFDLLYTTNQTS